jgi:hypothetical protein
MAVYFIKGETTGLIKIGRSLKVSQRLIELQVGSPDILTVLAVLVDEGNDGPFHRRFEADNDHGEWFRPSETLMAFIGTIPESSYDGLRVASIERTKARQDAKDKNLNQMVVEIWRLECPTEYAEVQQLRRKATEILREHDDIDAALRVSVGQNDDLARAVVYEDRIYEESDGD